MSDGTTETTATETPAVETTVTPPAVATPPTPPATPATTNNPTDYARLPDDHPMVKALATIKGELKTFKDAATQAEQDKLKREQRYEELLPQKITEATAPLQTQLETAQKALDKKAKAYDELQTLYTGLQSSVATAEVQSTVKSAYLASGPIKEGADAAFDVIWKTHGSTFAKDGDVVKAGDKDLATFFGELKTAPVFSGMFASEQKPSGTGTPPNKAVATSGTGKASINAADMTRRNWGTGENPLRDIIEGRVTVVAEGE